MKTAGLLSILLILASFGLNAQPAEGGTPLSFSLIQTKSTAALPIYRPSPFDKARLLVEDSLRLTPFRYAVFEDVSIDLKSSGRRDSLPAGAGITWRLRIASDSARSVQLIFKKFRLPEGARLFVYDDTRTHISGAFTSRNMRPDSAFVLADFKGNHLVIEYNEPIHPAFRGELIIGAIGQAYRDILVESSDDSYVNINCEEGKDLQLLKHAVCKMTFRSGLSSYLCSGALINNRRQDGTPYFLTANHCISDSAGAASLVAYFNYENEGCSGSVKEPLTLSGSRLLTGSAESDYTLLLLNDKPTAAYQAYYAGWNAQNEAAERASGIHHPSGNPKKLSLDFDSIVSNSTRIQWEGNTVSPVGSHWQVNYDVGLTAGGSSGSPLYNAAGQIIGQLHGGDDTYDLYGKLSYSWNHPSRGYPSLRSFLDPDNTGTLVSDGYSVSGNPPDAFFAVALSQVCTQAPVRLKDYSVFGPYTRSWSISPATYTFVEGTSSASPEPVVQFDAAGSYTVKLRIFNANGADTMKLINAVHAGEIIEVEVASSPEQASCLCDFDEVKLWATGADGYQWMPLTNAENIVMDATLGDTVVFRPAPGVSVDSSYEVIFRTIGTHGRCADTLLYSYNLIKPVNDYIQDARLIQYGSSEVFSNKCATVEPGEPAPPYYSCTTQYSWCDEYGTGENIVENSLWFRFVASESGHVSISSSGFDNEIALYDAEDYMAILEDNYTLLAANDDRSTTDFNPLIRSESVTPGKTYWIQVDGSGGGSTGDFSLNLIALTVSGTKDTKEENLLSYPQPAHEYVHIKGISLQRVPFVLSVFSSAGILMHESVHASPLEALTLDVSLWKPGFYVCRIQSHDFVAVTRIVKY